MDRKKLSRRTKPTNLPAGSKAATTSPSAASDEDIIAAVKNQSGPISQQPLALSESYRKLVKDTLAKTSQTSAVSVGEDDAYEPPKSDSSNVKEDYKEGYKEKRGKQKLRHRDVLMYTIAGLAVCSFALLVIVVVCTMKLRINNPDYVGVSDTVINILSVSVFGQVLTAMGALAFYVWKDEDQG